MHNQSSGFYQHGAPHTATKTMEWIIAMGGRMISKGAANPGPP